ncbi:MAG: PHP domain-containing protein, partial [Planctomycetia bacterium]
MDEPPYAELHCRSNFSFLEGGSLPEELVTRSHALRYEAIAITDRSTLAGIVRAHGAAKQAGIRLIVGAHLEPVDAVPLVVWATSRTGYSQLCRLLTRGYQAADRGAGPDAEPGGATACLLSLADIAAHAEGLLAGVPLAAVAAAGRRDGDGFGDACEAVLEWGEVVGDGLGARAEVALEGDAEERLRWYATVGRRTRVPLVAAGDVRYHERSRLPLFDALTAVRHGATVEEVRGRLLANGERHLHGRRRIAGRFATLAGAVERSVEIARRCTFSLAELRYEYPDANVPAGRTPTEHLANLAWRGAAKRYAGEIPDKVRKLVEHELALVAELGYEAYFLTVFDIVRFARRRGILCQGRGSAANSALCYCLGITSVDPARMNVLFERFVSRERREAPDI